VLVKMPDEKPRKVREGRLGGSTADMIPIDTEEEFEYWKKWGRAFPEDRPPRPAKKPPEPASPSS
jgi:hypothetical protein